MCGENGVEQLDSESFKRIAKLVGICPFADICQTPNWYWYDDDYKRFVAEVCFTTEHQKCTCFEGLVAHGTAPGVSEEEVRKFITANKRYKPNPILSQILSKTRSEKGLRGDSCGN